MRTTVLTRTGDAFKVMFTTNEGEYLFTVGLSGTLCRLWRLETEAEKLDAANQLGQIVSRQSTTVPNKDEYHLFTSENTEPTLKKTLERL